MYRSVGTGQSKSLNANPEGVGVGGGVGRDLTLSVALYSTSSVLGKAPSGELNSGPRRKGMDRLHGSPPVTSV